MTMNLNRICYYQHHREFWRFEIIYTKCLEECLEKSSLILLLPFYNYYYFYLFLALVQYVIT